MPLSLTFTVTFNDFLAAQRLHAKRSLWLRINQIAGRIVAPIWGVLILILAYMIHGPGVSIVPLLIMALCAGLLILYPFYMRFKLKRCYTRTRLGDGTRTIEFNQQSIRSQETNVKSDIEWAAIQSISEDKNVLMLYLAAAKFMLIPKRVCSEGQLDELRSLFQNHIKSTAK